LNREFDPERGSHETAPTASLSRLLRFLGAEPHPDAGGARSLRGIIGQSIPSRARIHREKPLY
jgi:hypothetical protein